jgi:hypothetical protein
MEEGRHGELADQFSSTSVLVKTLVRRKNITTGEPSLSHWPLRENVLTPDSDTPLVQDSTSLDRQTSEVGSLMLVSARPSEDLCGAGWLKPSFDRGVASQIGSFSSSGGRPHFFMRPERRPNRSSAPSVHLYSMGISQHMRSNSSLGTALGRSHPGAMAPPTPSQTPGSNLGSMSNSGFASDDLPSLPLAAPDGQ